METSFTTKKRVLEEETSFKKTKGSCPTVCGRKQWGFSLPCEIMPCESLSCNFAEQKS
jgi:hypothetical protein